MTMASDDDEEVEFRLKPEEADAIKAGRADVADSDMAVLEKLHHVAVLLEQMRSIVKYKIKQKTEAATGNEDGMANLVGLAATMRHFRNEIDILHHDIGHVLFDDCWKYKELGEEFEEPANALMQALRAAGFRPSTMSSDQLVAKLEEMLGLQDRTRPSGPFKPEIMH